MKDYKAIDRDQPSPEVNREQSSLLIRYWPLIAFLVLLAGFISFNSVGCVPRAQSVMEVDDTKQAASPVDELTLAFEALRGMNNPSSLERDQFRRVTGNRSVTNSLFYLKQWLARQDVDAVKWELDPLFRNLPRALREHPAFRGIDYLDFSQSDLDYLQQCLWLNDIAQRVSQDSAPPELTAWLEAMDKSGQIDGARQLRQAERLFDWTVRNIQLQLLLPQPKGPELKVEEGKQIDQRPPYERGVPGPGYQQLTKHALQFAQGDAWERGRIFVQLCRQAGIPAVMLGIIHENELGGPQAWAAAVYVNEEFYLFDPQLGLAIPGPDRKSIATLSQFIADESLRAALQPPGGEVYPITAENLKNIAVLIESQPESLSRRMKLLEEPLNNARAQSRTEPKPVAGGAAVTRFDLVLTAQPNEWDKKFRRVKHISSVGLWRVPYEAILYAIAIPEASKLDPKISEKWRFREAMMTNEQMIYLGDSQTVDRSLVEGQQQRQRQPRNVTLNQGRDYLLRGRFEDLETAPGARSVYLSFRPSAQKIKLYESSPDFLREMLSEQEYKFLGENPEQRARYMDEIGKAMRYSKNTATFWLGLSYFETGKFENAIQWLEPIARGESGESEWQAGARYVTARSYEALGKNDIAARWYLADDSPQAAGNKLRAEWLKGRGE
ncbi:CDC27 family protein [Anatilimnocola floriformis]|uniref:CDC27 family protein n=1 Tax=Anatilimnocola floriformis TaxID=2948575 RepID=UPI0020C349EB|nr:CDC27 family protein [Anatilimnocola floriformis]